MNRTGICLLLLLLTVLITNCSNDRNAAEQQTAETVQPGKFPPEIVEFTPFDGNPVFTGSGKDTWDTMIRERGYILYEGNTFHMWYTGYNDNRSDTKYLGYATSPDGIQWTRHPDNPLFNLSWVEDMQVVKHNGVYYMFAEGRNDIAHMLTSTDRVHWQDQGKLDIRNTSGESLSPGPYGTPAVWIEDGIWYLFYERNDEGVWLATSADRSVWTNISDEPVLSRGPDNYDREAVALNQVVKYNGLYYAWYHACAHQPWRDWTTNVAVSKDLIHWEKYTGNPVISGDKSSGILVNDGRKYRLYTMHPDVRIYFPEVSHGQ